MGRVLVLVEFSHWEADSVKELFLVKTVPCSDIVPVLWSCQTFHHLYPAQNFILRDGRSAGDGLSVRCHICKAAYRHLRSLLCRCTVEPLVHLRGHVIVGVQKTDPLAPCCLHTCIPGRAQPAVLLPDGPDAAVPPGVFLHDVPAVVRGAVVHHDDLKLLPRLGQQAVQTLRQILFDVIDRNDDRDQRLFCIHLILFSSSQLPSHVP